MNLEKVISTFQDKISNKEKKINDQLTALGTQEKELKADIETFMKQLISAELHEDADKQKSLNDSLTSMRQELGALVEKIQAYKIALTDPCHTVDDIKEIRIVAREEKKSRHEQLMASYEKKEQIRQQIKALENQIQEIENQQFSLNQEKEVILLRSIAEYIDARLSKLANYMERDRILNYWIEDSEEIDIESFFPKSFQEERKPINCCQSEVIYPAREELFQGKVIRTDKVVFEKNR